MSSFRKAVGFFAVSVVVAGVLGWGVAKYSFEKKQRAAVEKERIAEEQGRKRFFEECFEAVRTADDVEVVDGVESIEQPHIEKITARFSDAAWCAKLADALSKSAYDRGAHMLVFRYPQLRFYRNKQVVLSLQYGERVELYSAAWFYSVLVADDQGAEAIRALLREKRSLAGS